MVKNMATDPGLARLVELWAALPAHAKATILSIADAATPKRRAAA